MLRNEAAHKTEKEARFQRKINEKYTEKKKFTKKSMNQMYASFVYMYICRLQYMFCAGCWNGITKRL